MSELRPLPALVLEPAARVLNASLAADPEALRMLRPLAGRSVSVEISDLRLVVALRVAGERLELGGPDGDPDSTVRGSLASLMGAARSGTPRGLEVAGDAELVHGLARVMSRLPRAAWERVATILGAGPARMLERLGGALVRSLEDTRERIGTTVAEYLQYEARLVVGRPELEDFLADVDALRSDADRLAQRVHRLSRNGGIR